MIGYKFRLACGLVLLAFSVLSGCASANLQLRPTYQPVGVSKGKGGVVVLAAQIEAARPEGWFIGEVRESGGKVKGLVISETAPSILVRDALQQELLRAGYTVQIASGIPKGEERGLVLNKVSLKLDELSSLVKSEADCRVSFSVEIWKNGAKTNTLTFESRNSDFAVKDREKLHYAVLQKALGSAFTQAVPALVEQLGK